VAELLPPKLEARLRLQCWCSCATLLLSLLIFAAAAQHAKRSAERALASCRCCCCCCWCCLTAAAVCEGCPHRHLGCCWCCCWAAAERRHGQHTRAVAVCCCWSLAAWLHIHPQPCNGVDGGTCSRSNTRISRGLSAAAQTQWPCSFPCHNSSRDQAEGRDPELTLRANEYAPAPRILRHPQDTQPSIPAQYKAAVQSPPRPV
jgi:hypothetical protein